jgi:hypothetical protein
MPIHYEFSSTAGAVRARLLLQLLATVAILAWVPTNIGKLGAFLIVWAIGFGARSRREVAVLFAVLNYGALKHGVFQFRNPDVLGMPVYEFLMWGFYLLNTIRFVGGETPTGDRRLAFALAILFAAPFATINDSSTLTLVSALILVVAVGVYHERLDLAYLGYTVAMGALIEYVGVHTGQWSYPGAPAGGVPPWFVTMWGGVGLFGRRLLLPVLHGERARRALFL